jgi:ribosomal protein S18 acetylase RimI-like enzyme
MSNRRRPATARDRVGEVSVRLRPMTDDEFAAWLPQMRERYASDMVEFAGMSPERATAKAVDDIERLFPGGRPSPQQLVYLVEADGEPVGDLWLAERDDTLEHSLFIFDIRLDEAHRGRGYGKAAMLFAEEEARRRGLDRVALNVFGGNVVARGLYRSLGYEENAVAMSKTL